MPQQANVIIADYDDEEGAKAPLAPHRFDADPDKRATVDCDWDRTMDELVAVYRAGMPK